MPNLAVQRQHRTGMGQWCIMADRHGRGTDPLSEVLHLGWWECRDPALFAGCLHGTQENGKFSEVPEHNPIREVTGGLGPYEH